MNFFVSCLVLLMPGVVAVCIHNKKLIHITRDNWQRLMWEFLLYSFAIVFSVNVVMFLTYPQRTVSFSPWTMIGNSNTFMSSFIVKYTIFSLLAAWGLPKLWNNRHNIGEWWKNRKNNKLGDDE